MTEVHFQFSNFVLCSLPWNLADHQQRKQIFCICYSIEAPITAGFRYYCAHRSCFCLQVLFTVFSSLLWRPLLHFGVLLSLQIEAVIGLTKIFFGVTMDSPDICVNLSIGQLLMVPSISSTFSSPSYFCSCIYLYIKPFWWRSRLFNIAGTGNVSPSTWLRVSPWPATTNHIIVQGTMHSRITA